MPVKHDQGHLSAKLTPRRKRKLGDAQLEVADSEDDDDAYGWDDDDDAIPPMPSQWQGSEDLLIEPKPGEDSEPSEAGSNPGDDASETQRQSPRHGISPSSSE